MKPPLTPPPMSELLQEVGLGSLMTLHEAGVGPEVGGKYVHWDQLRYLTDKAPDGLDLRQWWLGIKFARQALARKLPLHDKFGDPFSFSLSDSLQRRLFLIGRDAAGALKGIDRMQDSASNERFLIRSLIEEAMTSSQLEGAATTSQAAKDMLRSGRKPRDYGERMIFNNYATMRELKRWADDPLTPETVFEIHRLLTHGTLKDYGWAGRFRSAEDNIVIEDENGRLLHVPPRAEELPQRLHALCDFANDQSDESFVHPVVRAIIIHFQIGYDHPFCDGNGRTARALFYWSMLRSGFWMMEYLSISSILRKSLGQYVRAYLRTETDGSDVTYFIDHQLDVILAAIEGLHGYMARKRNAQYRAETLLKPGSRLAKTLNHRQRALLLHALRHPDKPYTIEGHRRSHDVTYQTARSDLLGLASAELMKQHKHGRSFVFIAAEDLASRIRG